MLDAYIYLLTRALYSLILTKELEILYYTYYICS